MMDSMTTDFNEAMISMRRHLHQYPETSHEEKETASYISNFLKQFNPDKLLSGVGGHGIAAVFNGKSSGETVVIRSELDGLPINEVNEFKYISKFKGKGHLCGHDGHMTMVAGLAPLISVSRPKKGSVILLFQPAEETGEGADLVMKDEKFKKLNPDYIFALHNLPGFSEASIITRKGVFASASKGLILRLEGKSSHAGHPEGGNNPSIAAAQIIQSVLAVAQRHVPMHEPSLITPIHTRIGNPAFGTSPGEGVVMFTLRSHSSKIMRILESQVLNVSKGIARAFNLKLDSEWTEPFEAVHNDDHCVDIVEKSAEDLGLKIIQREIPFPWSEDFGVFTNHYKGALFGLGAGKDYPQLHNENYDFPDQILDKGTMIFYRIIDRLLNTE